MNEALRSVFNEDKAFPEWKERRNHARPMETVLTHA
jgi:hypothetical protein